jgi:hypothetical protein
MNSHATEQFWALYDRLPENIRRRADKAYRLWRRDPNNRGVDFKRVHTRQPIYAVRIGLHWRAVGIREGNTMIWFWIGSHEEYERLLKQL